MTKPFFRADQVGSLLRPADLLAARERHDKGEIDDAALHAAEDAAIADAVKKQEKAGLPVIMDGEFRRENFWIDFIRAPLHRVPRIDTYERGKRFDYWPSVLL